MITSLTTKMAKKIKTISSLLDELDKPLYESRWRDIEQTFKKTKKRFVIPEAFTIFLQGVELVESHLLGSQAQGQSTSSASVHPDMVLDEAEAKLKQCIDRCQPGHDASLQQLAKIKLGQLLWLRGECRYALVPLQEVQNTADILLLYTCKVLLEGNLYMGLCYEQLVISDARCTDADKRKYKMNALRSYEESLRHALSLLHSAKSTAGLTLQTHPAALKAIKTSIERGTLLAMQIKSPVRAFKLFRRVLQSKDEDLLQEARMVSMIKLSSLLLFHSSPASHTVPSITSHLSSFSPANLQEESILICLLAKSVTDSWTPSKTNSTPSPALIYDLLTLALSDLNLGEQIIQALEEGMRFACEMPHIWLQMALVLASYNQKEQALAVFHECIKLFPKDPLILATAANFAVEKMIQPGLCIEWATQALEVSGDHFLKPRIEFLLGRGYTMQADHEISSRKRGELHKMALVHLKKAADLDKQSVDFAFHLALQLAESRELVAASAEVKRALQLNTGHTSCLHLLSLILSAQKQYTEALKVCDFALQKQPENFGLLECKAKFEVISATTQQALKTCKHALQLWQKLFAEDITGLIGIVIQEQHSLMDAPLTQFERTASANEAFNADIASDAGSSHFSLSGARTQTNQPNLLQARIWCTIAEVFISAEKVSDAISCVREAQYLAPHLPSVLIAHGRVLEAKGNSDQGLKQYHNALALQPGNPTALTLIGRSLHHSDNHAEAEKYLREATSVDQLNHKAWYWLGEVFLSQGQFELSADCLKTSLDLERTTPIQPFSAVLSSFVPAD